MSLPAELIVAILELAYHGDPLTLDRPAMLACARVCRAWAFPAQALLFRDVRLPNKARLDAFLSALRPDARGCFLARAVRSLAIEPGRGGIAFPDLVAVLQACPRIYELELALSISDPLPESSLAAFRAAIPALRILHLNYRNMPAPVPQLLAACPAIHSLELRGSVSIPLPDALAPSASRPAFRLRELQFRVPFFCAEDQAACDMLSWTLAHSAGSLAILSLLDLPSDPTLDALLAAHAPSLRSLRLGGYNPDRLSQYLSTVRACPRLEELQLNFNPGPELLEAIPRSLEHLSFKNDERSMFDASWTHSIAHVIDALPAFPRLRVITYVGDKRIDAPERHTLKEKCDARKVHLRCIRKPLGAFTGETETLYLPTQFPRYIPVAAAKRPGDSF
ncbi:hypothetical protein BOTBODRAFT_25655 [Botryobasidium botryosum FD-172 SS1]|uniref:F-box domain-containing protein n=1 Tax=Botryobasidium botryosum (strain FD-172 SS1) TaxID=930990 RepID=A0A067NAS4_BOTB1|nr:hypothetical protein BOTBODRAFT_25655 [Botryobasidium botryosum FD-172 SS1]